MTDLLTDALPTMWEGRRIDPDFRHMVWLLNTYRRAETDEEKVQLMRDAAERVLLQNQFQTRSCRMLLRP